MHGWTSLLLSSVQLLLKLCFYHVWWAAPCCCRDSAGRLSNRSLDSADPSVSTIICSSPGIKMLILKSFTLHSVSPFRLTDTNRPSETFNTFWDKMDPKYLNKASQRGANLSDFKSILHHMCIDTNTVDFSDGSEFWKYIKHFRAAWIKTMEKSKLSSTQGLHWSDQLSVSSQYQFSSTKRSENFYKFMCQKVSLKWFVLKTDLMRGSLSFSLVSGGIRESGGRGATCADWAENRPQISQTYTGRQVWQCVRQV